MKELLNDDLEDFLSKDYRHPKKQRRPRKMSASEVALEQCEEEIAEKLKMLETNDDVDQIYNGSVVRDRIRNGIFKDIANDSD